MLLLQVIKLLIALPQVNGMIVMKTDFPMMLATSFISAYLGIFHAGKVIIAHRILNFIVCLIIGSKFKMGANP